jgi:hypothetical protein
MSKLSYTLCGSIESISSKGEILHKINCITERKDNVFKLIKALEKHLINLEDERAELVHDYFDILIDEEEIDEEVSPLDEFDFIEDFDIMPDRKTRRDVLTAVESVKAKKSSRYHKMKPRNPRADKTKSDEKKAISKEFKNQQNTRCMIAV